MLSNLAQSMNAFSPISTNFPLASTLVNEVQFVNTSLGNFVTPTGNSTLVKLVHPANALS